MKIFIASDHGGFQLKEKLKNFLLEENLDVEDMGNTHFDSGDDYPQFILPLARKVAELSAQGEKVFGIILGRSGNGEAIAANKVKGIRAAVCFNEELARKARLDNDANIISIGADYVDFMTAKNTVGVFLDTAFSGEERHVRRLKMINDYESSQA